MSTTEVRKRKWDQEDDGLAGGAGAGAGANDAAAASEQNKQPKLEGTTNGQDAPSSAAAAAPPANGSDAPAPALSAADAAVAAAARIAAQVGKPRWNAGSKTGPCLADDLCHCPSLPPCSRLHSTQSPISLARAVLQARRTTQTKGPLQRTLTSTTAGTGTC